MATYKILQDIEAEDKLLGPLTLRQFLYAGVTVVLGFIAFKLASLSIYAVIPFIPFIALFAILAAPFGHDQPNEIWLIARVNFFLKPHKRVWDQNVIHELVTITAPKKVEQAKLKTYSESEAESRLQELARTIDTHGWSVKNVNVNLYAQPTYLFDEPTNDRLVNVVPLQKEVPDDDLRPEDDMFESTNPNTQNINQIIDATTQSQRKYHENLASGISKPVKPATQKSPLFANKKSAAPTVSSRPIVIQPPSKSAQQIKQKTPTTVTAQTDNAILGLAFDNNKSVATLAHEGDELRGQDSSGEVVISLH